MTVFFLYLIKSVLCLALFYLFYMVLLSRETFHRFNRMTLIGILLASVIIPACRITTEEPMLLSQLYQRWENWLMGQETDTGNETAIVAMDWAEAYFAPTVEIAEKEPFSLMDFMSEHWGDLLFMLYVAGILFLVGRHLVSTFRLFGLLRQGQMQCLDDGTRLYLHPRSDIAPFSWMRYIVISEADYRENGRQIVAHEQAHISNRHSWDLLLVEFCLLPQWFNPAAWLLRQELQNVHEYEADDTVLRRGINAKEYQLLIIKKAVGARLYSLANSLNHSSLKQRLTMMMKEKSHPWARLKYLYVLPLAAISMVAFAHTEAANNSNGVSEAKGTEVSANNQTSTVKSKEGTDAIRVVAYSEDLHGPKKAPACIVLVDNKGGYQYGAEGAMKNGSLEEVANYVNDRRKESNSAGNGAHFKVQLVADEEAPQESVDKLKEALRKIYVLQIDYHKTGDEVFQVVEKMPEYPGGMGELMNYLTKNVKYPKAAMRDSIQGRVIVQFVISKTGKVTNPTILRSVSPELDAEAIRVVNSMPLWTPGEQRGKAVNVKFTLPIQFRLASPNGVIRKEAEKIARPNELTVMGQMKVENKLVTKDSEGRVLSEVMLPANATKEEIDAARRKIVEEVKNTSK